MVGAEQRSAMMLIRRRSQNPANYELFQMDRLAILASQLDDIASLEEHIIINKSRSLSSLRGLRSQGYSGPSAGFCDYRRELDAIE